MVAALSCGALNGSVAEGVARHSNVPVLLAPPTASV
jgi:nucleotide-binding universal stress UspA family protein